MAHAKVTKKENAKDFEKANVKATERENVLETVMDHATETVKVNVMETVMAIALLDHTVQSFERESCFQHKMDLSAESVVM